MEQEKLKVIFYLNEAIEKLRNTTYYKDLHNLRKKYIYKDISKGELIKDIKYLKDINEIIGE